MTQYPPEILEPDEYGHEVDDGTMPANVAELADAVVGHRIVSAEQTEVPSRWEWGEPERALVLTLDNGTQAIMRNSSDCCAYTELEAFLLHPEAVNHVILGVGTTGKYTTWHIYADMGDVLTLTVDWSAGNPFYYGYGFHVEVTEIKDGS